jgi:O-antigen biosynthesis protein
MNTIQPTVTIALPAFNAEEYLAESIQSLLDQTFTDFELIISDNASEDSTGDVCREFAARDRRIRYYRHQTNIGANHNYCSMLEESRGEYFLLASDHDLWAAGTVEHYLKEISSKEGAVLVYSPATVIGGSGEVLRVDPPDVPTNLGMFSTFLNVISGKITANAVYGLVKADILRKTSIHTSIGADTLLLAELSLYGDFCQIDTSHYFRRQNRPPESIREKVIRQMTMLFNDANVHIRTMPYEYMAYKALCMVQNNSLFLQQQRVLNGYILEVFGKSWGVTPERLAGLLAHIKDHQNEMLHIDAPTTQPGKRDLKPERMNLDINTFLQSIQDTPYSGVAAAYETHNGTRSCASNNGVSHGGVKKWNSDKQYDVCYILYDTSKWGGVKGTLVQVNGLIERGYSVCLVAASAKPSWFLVKADFIQSPKLSPQDIPDSDVIIGTWYPTVLTAYQSRKGIAVHYCRGYEAQSPDLSNDQKALIRDIYRLPIIKIANSPNVVRLIRKEFGQDAYMVHNDIDHEIFSPRGRRPEQGRKRILIVGPYEVGWKGIGDCLAACEILKRDMGVDIEVIRASQTSITAEETNISQAFGSCYQYYHDLSEMEMASLYNDSDLLLAGSRSSVESFGRPAMEALACGLPAVLTDIQAYKDFDTNHDYALFVPAGDPAAMAKAVMRVITDNNLREMLVARGLEVSAAYNVSRTLDELEGVLKEIWDKQFVVSEPKMPSPNYYGFPRPEVQAMVNPSTRRILDVGCAAGAMGIGLKKKLGAEVWAIEINPEAAKQAENCLDRVILSKAQDAVPHLPDNFFDTIIFADVLEHLEDPEAMLAVVKEKLSWGGEIIASVPNIRHWSILKDLLEGRWDYVEAGILDTTHLRFFTRKSLLELFQKAGYSVIELRFTTLGRQRIPQKLVNALAREGIDTSTLAEESGHYQYLVKATVGSTVKGLVSIIILTMNELNYTKKCIESVRKSTPEPYEIIFVDNGSKDGTVKWLESFIRENPQHKLIANAANVGFAKGCNQGIKAACGEYILLLNNDVVVTDAWLSGMLECLHSASDVGIVGPMTNNISGLQQVPAADYGSIEGMTKYADAFRQKNRYRRIASRRIVGFCMLFRRELVEQIGFLDESFGTGNFEDDDYCLRAILEGYRNVIAADVFVHHYGSRSFVGNHIPYGSLLGNNKKIFDEKWQSINPSSPLGKKVAVLNSFESAEKHSQRQEIDRAVAVLVEGIKHMPDNKAIYYRLAEILTGSERFNDAIEALNSMPEEGKAESRWNALVGYCKERMGLLDEAEQYAGLALAKDKDSPQALNLAGLVAYKKGDHQSAETLFGKAIQSDPGYGESYTSLGLLKWNVDDRSGAVNLFEKGFILAPTASDSVALYHSAISMTREFARAESMFQETHSFFPLNKRLHFLYIDVLLQQGKHQVAMEEIEKAIISIGADDGILAAALETRKRIGTPKIDTPKQAGTLSVCMIARDEEEYLPQCLMSLQPVADEIILVDTGSTDRTREIAQAFGAHVFDVAWTNDFSEARNFSLSKANGQWVLVHDADEVLSSRDYDKLRTLLRQASSRSVAISFVTRSYTTNSSLEGWTANQGKYPEEEAGTGWIPSVKVRLIPNDDRFRFENPVHELLEPSLIRAKVDFKPCKIPIHHYGPLITKRKRAKGEMYYLLGKQKLEAAGKDTSAIRELAIQAGVLGRYNEALRLWEEYATSTPKANAYYNMSICHLETGQFEQALIAAKKALDLDGTSKEAIFHYANASLCAGDIGDAISSLEGLIERFPDHPPARMALYAAYCINGTEEKGVQGLREMKQQNHVCAPWLHALSKNLVAANRTPCAIRVLEGMTKSGHSRPESKILLEECRKSEKNRRGETAA